MADPFDHLWPNWPGLAAVDLPPDRTIHVVRIRLPNSGTIDPTKSPELSADEIARASRYVVEPPRRQFVTTRVALRRLCGDLLSLPPREVEFEFAQFGKPAVRADQNPHGLTFNVSHSGTWAVIAFAWRRTLGVDIETQNLRLDWQGLARRFYSADEQQQLFALPAAWQVGAFYRIWTSKEAYLKATGLGMSLPLDSFSVLADPQQRPAVLQAAQEPDAAIRWHGAGFSVAENCPGSLLWDSGQASVACWNWA